MQHGGVYPFELHYFVYADRMEIWLKEIKKRYVEKTDQYKDACDHRLRITIDSRYEIRDTKAYMDKDLFQVMREQTGMTNINKQDFWKFLGALVECVDLESNF